MRSIRTRTLLVAGAIVALVLAGVISFYASQDPDGLEKVAADKGMDHKVEDHEFADGPLADYGVKGVDDERMSGGLAGIIGVGATLLVGTGVFWIIKRRSASAGGQGGSGAGGSSSGSGGDSGADSGSDTGSGDEARTEASETAAAASSGPSAERP